jgi:hypothetical protein
MVITLSADRAFEAVFSRTLFADRVISGRGGKALLGNRVFKQSGAAGLEDVVPAKVVPTSQNRDMGHPLSRLDQLPGTRATSRYCVNRDQQRTTPFAARGRGGRIEAGAGGRGLRAGIPVCGPKLAESIGIGILIKLLQSTARGFTHLSRHCHEAEPESGQTCNFKFLLRPDSSVVERGPEKAGVGGSIPSLATIPLQKRIHVPCAWFCAHAQ